MLDDLHSLDAVTTHARAHELGGTIGIVAISHYNGLTLHVDGNLGDDTGRAYLGAWASSIGAGTITAQRQPHCTEYRATGHLDDGITTSAVFIVYGSYPTPESTSYTIAEFITHPEPA